ncbi:hypothetical protein [Archaeoglobus neptunius]|uniref:hypothetical protein n=1 Tax=Archaeoglobus neptunius TaxID=2798580 RepID=UPI001925A5B3|nr:hypothetical protein [Archaeoglobus neptunius]
MEKARDAIESIEPSELHNWIKQLPEIVAEKERAETLVLVFVVERLKEVNHADRNIGQF